MSAFQSYAGAYQFDDRLIEWRCYANARLHDLRQINHAPLPTPPPGKKWVAPSFSRGEAVALLVDQDVTDVSQILLQIDPPFSA